MKAFLLTKRYNTLMASGMILFGFGLFSRDWTAGLVMMIVGMIIWFTADLEPSETIPQPTPVPASIAPPVHASLLPIEWDKAFDEPAATIPPTFFETIHKRDVRL